MSGDGAFEFALEKNGYLYTHQPGSIYWFYSDYFSAPQPWTSLAVASPAPNSTLVAAAATGAPIRTATFSFQNGNYLVNNPTDQPSGARSWQALAMSADGSKISAVAANSFVYRSADYGASWFTPFRWVHACRVHACQPGRLPAASLADYLPACMLARLPACLLACLPTWLPGCLFACLPACPPACPPACLPACPLARLPACMPACPPARDTRTPLTMLHTGNVYGIAGCDAVLHVSSRALVGPPHLLTLAGACG